MSLMFLKLVFLQKKPSNLVFHWSRISPSLIKLFWSLLNYCHLLLCRANAAWRAVEKEKDEIIKYMKKQAFFIYLSFGMAFLFCFWENILITFYVARYMLFVPVRKRSNSRSQMFYKIDLLKILQYLQENICVEVSF